jgi:hypothetical protein
MPYMTNAGSPRTSLKVACGKQVGVNALIGMSFMTAAKLVANLDDTIIESKLLSCDPFPIIYKRLQQSTPNLVPVTGNRSENVSKSSKLSRQPTLSSTKLSLSKTPLLRLLRSKG